MSGHLEVGEQDVDSGLRAEDCRGELSVGAGDDLISHGREGALHHPAQIVIILSEEDGLELPDNFFLRQGELFEWGRAQVQGSRFERMHGGSILPAIAAANRSNLIMSWRVVDRLCELALSIRAAPLQDIRRASAMYPTERVPNRLY